MKTASQNSQAGSQGPSRLTLALVLLITAGIVGVVFIARWIDSHRPSTDAVAEAEELYLNGNTVRRMSLGFNGLVADWYWMRSLQYLGRKVLSAKEDLQIDNLGQVNLSLLAPLLDTATTVDPQFLAPYEYAAVVLPAVDPEPAIQILKKGIAANPSKWRLHQHLGYIYWKQGNFQAAAETYGQGAAIPGAPPWVEAMKAQMAFKGGSRSTAQQIYARMYQGTDDPGVREMAKMRLIELQSLDEQDQIRRVLAEYAANEKRCPSSWKDVAAALRRAGLRVHASGVPVDPLSFPYRLVKEGCDVDLDPSSEVPKK